MPLRLTRRHTLLAWAGACALPWAAPAHADLAGVIAASKGSVLPIGTYRETDSPRFAFRGSCFVVGDGTLVATNHHVLPEQTEGAGAPALMVMTSRSAESGQLRRARLVAADRARDLAVLRLEGKPLQPLALVDPGTAREGQSVALLGFPIGGVLGFAPVTHRGIIASITTAALPAANARALDPRALVQLREGTFEVFQLDATAYPGNSGGPVLDADSGQVLAIVNMVLVKGSRESALSHPTGITYAIPVRHLQELLKGL